MITAEVIQRTLDFLKGFEDCEHNAELVTELIRDIESGHETTVPFDGFYESHSDSLIDQEIEDLFDPEGNGNGVVPDAFHMVVDFSAIRVAYCKLYTEELQSHLQEEHGLDIDLKFKELDSPREYNFHTDVLVVEITDEGLHRLFAHVLTYLRDEFELACIHSFTSGTGFISRYNPDWKTWGAVTEWDHNQIGALFEAFPLSDTAELMEDAQGNGQISSLVWEELNEEAKALVPEHAQ